jgi:hypothetical protein
MEIGASPILNYKIRSDQGSAIGTWADFDTIPAAIPYAYTLTGLTPGETYKIRVVAENLHGFGPESEDFVAMAADQPDQPLTIVTTNEHTKILLSWQAPFNNQLPIVSYQTQVLSQIDGQFYHVCLDQPFLECRVPIQDLRDTYGFSFQELPQFQTRALNQRGHSGFSPLNTGGALI